MALRAASVLFFLSSQRLDEKKIYLDNLAFFPPSPLIYKVICGKWEGSGCPDHRQTLFRYISLYI